jgi:hypothetical protein
MSTEIKLASAPVEKALEELKTSLQGFEVSFAEMKGDNSLEMVDKLEEMKKTFEELVSSYQTLLLDNAQATVQAVENLKETDESVATSIHQK